jgi:hydrogenase maturation protease
MRIAVLGLGNVLMGDDGFGPFVIRHLETAFEFPENVSIEDLGTPGLDLIPFLADVDAVIFVDVVRATGNPGDVRIYHMEQILQHAPNPRMTPHDPGVKAALLTLKLAGLGPSQAKLVGVIPSAITTGPGLSDPVARAVKAAAREVLSELEHLGVDLTPRYRQEPSGVPWWEQPTRA